MIAGLTMPGTASDVKVQNLLRNCTDVFLLLATFGILAYVYLILYYDI